MRIQKQIVLLISDEEEDSLVSALNFAVHAMEHSNLDVPQAVVENEAKHIRNFRAALARAGDESPAQIVVDEEGNDN